MLNLNGYLVIFILHLLPNLFLFQFLAPRCLHKGCEMSGGLYRKEIDMTVENLLEDEEEVDFKDNVLSLTTWNLKLDEESRNRVDLEDRMKKLCKFLNELDPKILGLQEVREVETRDLKSCLTKHIVIRGEGRISEGEKIYNAVIVKKWNRMHVVENGSFSLTHNHQSPESTGNDSAPSCTWARLRLAERKTEFPRLSEDSAYQDETAGKKLLRIMKLFINRGEGTKEEEARQKDIATLKTFLKSKKRIVYQWFDFYVAVTTIDNQNEKTAKKQLHLLAKHLKNKVMKRRRYPIFVMGYFGFEDNTKLYDYLDNISWLKNTMSESLYNYPTVSLYRPDYNEEEGLVDYIWFDQFKGILSATLADTKEEEFTNLSKHLPVFAAVVPAK